MRVISGEFGGRRLVGPADANTTRPVTDRVKQSLFDKLTSNALLESGHVVDLFCGTGSMGIEALSRGSDFCTFVERDADAVNRLNKNLDTLDLHEYARVHQGPAAALMWAHSLSSRGPVQVAFLDPPYALMRGERDTGSVNPGAADAGPIPGGDPAGLEAMAHLMAALLPHMDPTGVLVLRTPIDVDPLPVTGWRGPNSDRYGGMKLAYYAPEVVGMDEVAALPSE